MPGRLRRFLSSVELRPEIQRPLQRFFLQFFKQLALDTQVLVSKQVESSLQEVKLLQGVEEIDPVFESESVIASVREDGKDLGDLHLLFDVRSAIAFSGLMMMMAPGTLGEMVQLRRFDETLQEAFQEIGNIAAGTLNSLVESKIEGGHLLMEGTAFVHDMQRPEAVGADSYLDVVAEIAVGDFDRETFHILVSRGVAEALGGAPLLLEEEIPDSAATTAAPIPSASSKEAEPDLAPSAPLVQGELASLMVDPASSADEADTVSQAIATMKAGDARQIGVLRKGVLIRVISRSDLRQLKGPFYGTNAMSPRDRAVLNLQLGKVAKNQQLVSIPVTGSTKEAVDLVIENDLRSLPVVDEKGALLGFIPARELLKLLRGLLH